MSFLEGSCWFLEGFGRLLGNFRVFFGISQQPGDLEVRKGRFFFVGGGGGECFMFFGGKVGWFGICFSNLCVVFRFFWRLGRKGKREGVVSVFSSVL